LNLAPARVSKSDQPTTVTRSSAATIVSVWKARRSRCARPEFEALFASRGLRHNCSNIGSTGGCGTEGNRALARVNGVRPILHQGDELAKMRAGTIPISDHATLVRRASHLRDYGRSSVNPSAVGNSLRRNGAQADGAERTRKAGDNGIEWKGRASDSPPAVVLRSGTERWAQFLGLVLAG
jgi:hypothetical protein